MRRRLLTLASAAAPEPGPARSAEPINQTPSGLLLPPGVAEKLSARAAIAAAEALVAALPVLPSPARTGSEVGIADLLTQVKRLSGELAAVKAELAATKTRTETIAASAPNEAVGLLAGAPLFLDYETTHKFLKDGARVCEVSVIDRTGQVIFSTLVNPEQPIPPESTAVHGISDADVADAPTWPQIAPRLQAIVAGRTVAVFYEQFERKFTPREWPIDWVCVKKIADRLLGPPQMDGLGSLANRLKQLGLKPGPAHTGAGDCLSTLRLVQYLAGDRSPVELNYQS